MKRNDGHHPTLNLDTVSNSSTNTLYRQVISPTQLSAKWASFIDPSKIPADWAWRETLYGNILDWGRYPDYEKYSRKDKAKYGPKDANPCTQSEVKSKISTPKPPQRKQKLTPMDKAAENYKYNTILNMKVRDDNETGTFLPQNNDCALKSALKPTYGRPTHTPKKVYFADQVQTHPPQPSTIKRTVLTLKTSFTKHIPPPHHIRISILMITKILASKLRNATLGDQSSEWCLTPTTPTYTWFDRLRRRPEYSGAGGFETQEGEEGRLYLVMK